MSDLVSELLRFLCTGLGEGNTNTDKLTKYMVLSYPDRDYNQTKIEIVEALRELKNSGQIQIITTGWELGQEFFYICANRLE
ncbi:MAG: hypothetical protein ACREOB_09710 [Thermodesulfobacteriota bacterium]